LKLLVIDNYDSFTFNLIQLVEQAGVNDYFIEKNDNLKKLDNDSFDKCLISPGPGIAIEAGDLMWFIDKFHSTKSILGICLGHEAIAEYFGAKLVQLPQPLHGIKNKATIVNQDSIFNGIPTELFIGHYHSWNVDEDTLPNDMEIIVRDETGLNMAIRHKQHNLTGLQFHPESIMTEYGLDIIKNWLDQ
jgi:anthranilate synthase component 2